MKLHTDRNEVERSNVATESAFRIKTTAKAFDILSSGLYTDRILAVVRELSCNAYDAHAAANNPDPFEIHIPNALEPWFHVKDFGTGLSDEDVMNLYSTYFDSTKTNSNDYIGALGLGSKSPFSYTKAFEVISRFEYVKRTYSVFINEDGVPTIAKLGEFVTDEHNGLEVRITAKKEDYWTFQDKIRQALRWFPVKPTIVGATHFEWLAMPKENLSGEGWAMFNSNFAGDYSKMTAVQGNVAYKVDISKLNFTSHSVDMKLLQNCHIVGFFNIGELEVAASREEIRYDDRSAAALVKKIKDVRAGILASVEKRVEKLEADNCTPWTIMIHMNKMANEMFGSEELFTEFIKDSKNESINWYIATGGGVFKLPELHGHEVVAYTLGHGGDPLKAQIKRSWLTSGVEPSFNTAVFFNDMKTGGIAKITHFLRTKAWTSIPASEAIRTVIMIRKFDKTKTVEKIINPTDPKDVKIVTVEWTPEQFQEEYEKIIESLGDVEVKLTSTDAPAPPRSRNGDYKTMPIFQFKQVNVRRYGKSSVAWERVPADKIDLSKDSLYFLIRNGSIITLTDSTGTEKDVTWDINQIENYFTHALKLINDAQGTSFTMKNVFAVGSQAAKKVKKLPHWINLFDVLKTQMDQFHPAVEYFKRIQNTPDQMNIVHSIKTNTHMRIQFIEKLEELNTKSLFRLAMMPLIEDFEKYQNLSMICTVMQKLDVDLGTKIFDNVSNKSYFKNSIFNDYPMLSFVNNYQFLDGKQINLFFDYIKTIDRS